MNVLQLMRVAIPLFLLCLTGCNGSDDSVDTVDLVEQVISPIFDKPASTYSDAITVTISSRTPAAIIYYTLDGTMPDDQATRYFEPIAVNENLTLKAIAHKVGMASSEVVTGDYYFENLLSDPLNLPLASHTKDRFLDKSVQGMVFQGNHSNGGSGSFSDGAISGDANGNMVLGGYTAGYTNNGDVISKAQLPALILPQVGSYEGINTLIYPDSARWRKVLQEAPIKDEGSNPTRVSALGVYKDKVYILGLHDYDAAVSGKDNLLICDSLTEIEYCQLSGYFQMTPVGTAPYVGGSTAAYSSDYIAPIPKQIASLFPGQTHFVGAGGSTSIASRNPSGPSLYTINLDQISETNPVVEITPLLEYRLYGTELWRLIPELQLYMDGGGDQDYANFNVSPESSSHPYTFYNTSDMMIPWINDIYTQSSKPQAVFHVPNTRTLCFIGNSAMHDSGGSYKLIRDGDTEMSDGARSFDKLDNHTMYWLYDIKDIVNNGGELHNIKPYEYGYWEYPKQWSDIYGMPVVPLNIGVGEDNTVYYSMKSAAGRVGGSNLSVFMVMDFNGIY